MQEITIFVKEAVEQPSIQTLETILTQLEGVERALVDTEDGEVKIRFNQLTVSKEIILGAIRQHGLHISE